MCWPFSVCRCTCLHIRSFCVCACRSPRITSVFDPQIYFPCFFLLTGFLICVKVSVTQLSCLAGLSLKKRQISTLEVVRLHTCYLRCLLGRSCKSRLHDCPPSTLHTKPLQAFLFCLPPVSLHLPVSPRFLKHICADCWEAGAGASELSWLLWPLLFYWPVNISLWRWQHYIPWGFFFICPSQKICFVPTNQSSVTLWP